jgi:hypothetical protein
MGGDVCFLAGAASALFTPFFVPDQTESCYGHLVESMPALDFQRRTPLRHTAMRIRSSSSFSEKNPQIPQELIAP